MAPKRKIQEAFGKPNGQLSAFAAARLAKTKQAPAAPEPSSQILEELDDAVGIAPVPYDGRSHDPVSSDSEQEAAEIIVAVAPKPSSHVQLSTFKPGSSIVTESDDGSLAIRLRNNESATCVGEYDVELLEGVATVYGAVLYPGSGIRRVYALSMHALPRVTARKNGTVICLRNVKSSLRKLDNLSPLFRNIWIKDEQPQRTFALLHSTADDELQRSLAPLENDQATEAVLARLSQEAESTARLTRVLAVGAKSSGKSTFNRILCNTLLSKPSVHKVVYIDLDPGQPEFGPPGLISLVEVSAPILGPSFTHAASTRSSRYRLIRSHAIAATSFRDDPVHYTACAKELMQHASRQYPLVVNSCGWVSGTGASALQDLATTLGINHIVLMEPLDAALVEDLQASCSGASFHRVPRQLQRPSSRTPGELRSMQTMAYFHSRVADSSEEAKWTSKPISKWRPWTVPYDSSVGGIHTVLSYRHSPPPDFLAEVLEGSLVALVLIDEHFRNEAYGLRSYTTAGDSEPQFEDLIHRAPENLPYLFSTHTHASHPLDPRYSKCVGLALLRAIDPETKTLQLVTPLAEGEVAQLMNKRMAIVRGAFDTPEWAYLEDLHRAKSLDVGVVEEDRPWVTRREPVGIEGAVWRLRHPPMAGDLR